MLQLQAKNKKTQIYIFSGIVGFSYTNNCLDTSKWNKMMGNSSL